MYACIYICIIYHASNMIACTPKDCKRHYSVTTICLCPLDHLYKTCSVKHFTLPNLTFKAFRVDQYLVLVHPTCIKVSMRKAPGPGIWPYQAWASHKPPPLTDTLDGMLFLQPPKTTYQKYAFFGMLLKKPKYSFDLVEAIFSLE